MQYFIRIPIVLFILFVSASCYSQDNKFRAQLFILDSIQVAAGLIVFPLTRDSVNIDNRDTIVTVDLTNPKHRVFYFLCPLGASRVFRFNTNKTSGNITRVILQDTVFYKEFEERRVCPICLKSKYLIPIVYRLPLPKEFQLANKNKIYLGGCVYDIEKKYYCRKDEFDF